MADSQCRINDMERAAMAALEHLDDELVTAMGANQEARFHEALLQLISRTCSRWDGSVHATSWWHPTS